MPLARQPSLFEEAAAPTAPAGLPEGFVYQPEFLSRDQEAALAWAARCPGARFGTMEVRPIMALPG